MNMEITVKEVNIDALRYLLQGEEGNLITDRANAIVLCEELAAKLGLVVKSKKERRWHEAGADCGRHACRGCIDEDKKVRDAKTCQGCHVIYPRDTNRCYFRPKPAPAPVGECVCPEREDRRCAGCHRLWSVPIDTPEVAIFCDDCEAVRPTTPCIPDDAGKEDVRDTLVRALRIAAGMLSTFKGYSDKHPEQVYDELIDAADAAKKKDLCEAAMTPALSKSGGEIDTDQSGDVTEKVCLCIGWDGQSSKCPIHGRVASREKAAAFDALKKIACERDVLIAPDAASVSIYIYEASIPKLLAIGSTFAEACSHLGDFKQNGCKRKCVTCNGRGWIYAGQNRQKSESNPYKRLECLACDGAGVL